jgi:hypothetical protein
MNRISCILQTAIYALLGSTYALGAGLALPPQIQQDNTSYNLQSRRGVPISSLVDTNIGSDGRAPSITNNAYSKLNPTTNQWAGLAGFGGNAGLTLANWQSLKINPAASELAGTNAINGNLAQLMGLPVGYSNNLAGSGIAIFQRNARIASPYFTRPDSVSFGGVIGVPFADENGVLLTNLTGAYWLAEPYSQNNHAGDQFYWSPNAGQVYATQPGPIQVTWRKAQQYTDATVPNYTNKLGKVNFQTNGASIFLLYTANYVVSGTAAQTPQQMYWTEGVFQNSGRIISLPSRGVSLNIIYNTLFPQFVTAEYVSPYQSGPTAGTTNTSLQNLKTLYVDSNDRNLHAYNLEGRVFIELLGDLRPDGQTRVPLGIEIVDVSKQPNPADVVISLGERITPPSPGSIANLIPALLDQATGPNFVYQQPISDTDLRFYATRATQNLNDLQVFWLDTGVAGLHWPTFLARYQLAWPADVSRYSQYIRPLVSDATEAALTAVQLSALNAPTIAFQDTDPNYPQRANITGDSKFYTFLDPTFPVHRTLLQFVSGNNVAFERVLSWLDVNLKTGNFAGTVAVNLTGYNPTNQTVNFPDPLHAPRVLNASAEVGRRINAPIDELGGTISAPYVAGHLNLLAGTLYDVNAYLDPLALGFDTAAQGAIIPINSIPGSTNLEVWWFRTNSTSSGPNAGDSSLGFASIYWPSVLGHYSVQWPANPREIVLASNLGGGTPTNSYELAGAIYYQNDPTLPGYNPNEEHAIISAGTVYATRDDLNITNLSGFSSLPYVLVDYTEQDGRPAMAVYHVARENPALGFVFDFVKPAGQILQAPMPLPLLGKPVLGSGDSAVNFNTEPTQQTGDLPVNWQDSRDTNGPYAGYVHFTYRDRHHDFWIYRGLHAGLPSLQAGTYVATNNSFAPLTGATAVAGQPFGFSLHASRQSEFLSLSVSNLAGSILPPWLSINGLSLSGRPGTNDVGTANLQLVVSDLYDNTQVTNKLILTVLASGQTVGQPPLLIASTNPVTGSVITFSNRPPFLALSPSGKNSFTMRYYYKTQPGFAFPGLDNTPPAGSIVPYLRAPGSSAGTWSGGDGSSTNSIPLDIVYRPFWPVQDPSDSSRSLATLPYGYTLVKAALNLPGVQDFKTAEILYQQSIATNISQADISAVLYDPTREKYSDISAAGLSKLPASVVANNYQGKVYFPGLPPNLSVLKIQGHDGSTLVYFDPNRGVNGSLVLRGVFNDAIVGDSYLGLNLLYSNDVAAVLSLCPTNDPDYSKWATAVGALATTMQTFYENPAAPGTYIANPNWDVSRGVGDLAVITNDNTAVDSYALSGTGPGSGYVVLLENSGTARTLPGDPVAMHIFKMAGNLYTGQLKVIQSPNPLSETITFQHSGDLAAHTSEYEYQWKIAAPVNGNPPAPDPTMSQYLALIDATNLPRYTIGGAGVQALGDNYLVMRYRPINPDHPLFNQWSDWTMPQLAEGWIKRVLGGINPFNQRTTDLFNNPVNTDVSLITQAGHRWEGDVALNADTLNSKGLIEIYETVLRRGRALSIESGYNYGPANDALLLAAGYLSDLYMNLGNEAFADSANPTIGIGTSDPTFGSIATALFSFQGQEPSLLEQQLAQLRGRDDFLQPGVRIAPAYNRLYWNYTRGIDAGEVIYALNYDIVPAPLNTSGTIGPADAAYKYPQGHGDAYGHYLTALDGYYSLLMNPYFDWVPSTEAVLVLGVPVQVGYENERKFSAAAAAVARAGAQIVDLTWRRDYQSVHTVGWSQFETPLVNPQTHTTRYWALDHWATRIGQGSFLNWAFGNAILPALDSDPTHQGIEKIDRTTVPELQELASDAKSLQTTLDNAESGMSPLGLPEGSIAFDLDPNVVVGPSNGTHFDQIYQRATAALNNAVASFDDAKDVTQLLRAQADDLASLQVQVNSQEQAYTNALIEIYGTPYPDDMGPGQTYTQDYAGPDLLHYNYVDRVELDYQGQMDPTLTTTNIIDIQQVQNDWSVDALINTSPIATEGTPGYTTSTNVVRYVLSPDGFFSKPATWTSQRSSPGKIQQAVSKVIMAHDDLQFDLSNGVEDKERLDTAINVFNSGINTWNQVRALQTSEVDAQHIADAAKFASDAGGLWLDHTKTDIERVTTALKDGFPDSFVAGLANGGDLTSAARGALESAGFQVVDSLDYAKIAKLLVSEGLAFATDRTVTDVNFSQIDPLNQTQNWREQLAAIVNLEQLLQNRLTTINFKLRTLDDAMRDYRTQVAAGDRLQLERQTYRGHVAALIQGYRTRDAAFRLFRNEKLERYKTLFDLAARYAFLAANAYDYETGLLNTDAGRQFINKIVNARALGVVLNGQPQFAGSDTGDPGLSSALAEMKADFDVLRGRLRFNNPDAYGTTASLRTENFRLDPTAAGSNSWQQVLQQGLMPDLLTDPDVRRACLQIDPGDGLPVPGIVLTFETTIADGLNLFGHPLVAGDHAYSSSSFANKIFAVGVALEGYHGMDAPSGTGSVTNFPSNDPLALSATPYVYLIPVGVDSMRSPPLGDASTIRTWSVEDVAIPLPFNIGASDFSTQPLFQSSDTLTEPFFAARKHEAFRPVPNASFFSDSLYGSSGSLLRSQYTNSRLIGRSVWNSQWKLVIPGKALLADPNDGLARLISTLTDVKLHFVTYSYSGN